MQQQQESAASTTSTTTTPTTTTSSGHGSNNNSANILLTVPSSEVEQYKQRIKDLENENIKLKSKIEKLQNANTNLQLQVEEEEELITNKLMKKLNRLKKEKETLVKQVEEEEELLTNTLQKKLEKVQQEKVFIESKLKQDKEYIVTQLRKQLESVLTEKYEIEKQIEKERSEVLQGVQNILQNLNTSETKNDIVQKLSEQVDILNKEQKRLASDSDNYRQKNLKLLKEYSRLESENFILEQKIKREMEKRKEMDSQKMKDEFDLEISSEREFNQIFKSKLVPSGSAEDLIERSRRSHSLPPSSQPPVNIPGVPVNNNTNNSHSTSSPLRGSTTPRGTDYTSPQRKSSFSPKPTGIPIASPRQIDDSLSNSLPTHSNLMGSSFAERLSQVNPTITDPYATTRIGSSPRLGSSSQLTFIRQSPRKH